MRTVGIIPGCSLHRSTAPTTFDVALLRETGLEERVRAGTSSTRPAHKSCERHSPVARASYRSSGRSSRAKA